MLLQLQLQRSVQLKIHNNSNNIININNTLGKAMIKATDKEEGTYHLLLLLLLLTWLLPRSPSPNRNNYNNNSSNIAGMSQSILLE